MGSGLFKSQKKNTHKLIPDKYHSYDDLAQGLKDAGVESSQLIIGIDFTKSNARQGGDPFYESENLHSKDPYPNPYQQAMKAICSALASFDDDGMIPAYGFGDSTTTNKSVFTFLADANGREVACHKLEAVLQCYNNIIDSIESEQVKMSGPTSFVPIINKAIEIVKNAKSYHILIILCDGGVDNPATTAKAIVEASHYPLSIICIGVGRGPWDQMIKYDDSIPKRDFDNFQFVNFHKIMHDAENADVEFATRALMEIPDQYMYIKRHLLQ